MSKEELSDLSWNDLGRLRVNKLTNEIYWDGKKLKTASRLAWPERTFAAIGAFSGLLIAIIQLLRFLGHGHQ